MSGIQLSARAKMPDLKRAGLRISTLTSGLYNTAMSPRLLLPLVGLSLLLLVSLGIWHSRRAPAPVVINGTAVPALPTPDQARISQGEVLYNLHCASCHSPNLAGAPDWKVPLPDGSFPPPPHDDSGHTWHHPDFLLLQIISAGGSLYDGTMPGFAGQLSPDEMEAVLAYIKSSWTMDHRQYQWWLTNTVPTPTP